MQPDAPSPDPPRQKDVRDAPAFTTVVGVCAAVVAALVLALVIVAVLYHHPKRGPPAVTRGFAWRPE